MTEFLTEDEINEGDEVYICFNNITDRLWTDIFVPVRIDKAYERFFVGTVLPHINPKESFGMSKPYPMSIDKYDIQNGNVYIRRSG